MNSAVRSHSENILSLLCPLAWLEPGHRHGWLFLRQLGRTGKGKELSAINNLVSQVESLNYGPDSAHRSWLPICTTAASPKLTSVTRPAPENRSGPTGAVPDPASERRAETHPDTWAPDHFPGGRRCQTRSLTDLTGLWPHSQLKDCPLLRTTGLTTGLRAPSESTVWLACSEHAISQLRSWLDPSESPLIQRTHPEEGVSSPSCTSTPSLSSQCYSLKIPKLCQEDG